MKKLEQIFILLAAIGLCSQILRADEAVFANLKTAEQALFSMPESSDEWSRYSVSRSADVWFSSSRREFDMDGNVISSSNFLGTSHHAGTLMALPVGDFVEEGEFYYGGSGERAKTKGMIVSVKVQLSNGNGSISSSAAKRVVENLITSGMTLPKSIMKKPCPIMSLKAALKARFGAKNVKAKQCSNKGKIYFMLVDCNDNRADSTYLPATPKGASKSERIAFAEKLKAGRDNGGLYILGFEEETHPVGSPYAPTGPGWSRIN